MASPPPLRDVSEERRGGEGKGIWDPKVCGPKIAQINISFCIFHFAPTTKPGSTGGSPGEGGGPPPSSYGCQLPRPCPLSLFCPGM